jgi:uncharacterized SAM-binding protein YcdF (DUF218 family)
MMDSVFDATVVLGGGLLDASHLSDSTKSRLDTALAIYGGEKIIVVGAGPAESPLVVDGRGWPVFESVGAVRYLLQQGISAEQVMYETASYDTIGNAYFCRTIHTDPAGLARLRIITSAFHLPRTELAFDWVYGLDSSLSYQLSFVPAPYDHFIAERLALHGQKEKERMNSLRSLQSAITSLADLHQWLFTHHAAYSAHLQPVELTSSQEGRELLLKDD